VTTPAIPLRGIAHDSAYVASFLKQIPGPVLAVGHLYGGAVISNAAADAHNVAGLVIVAAFAPEEGERLGEVEATSRDSVLMSAQVALQYPTKTAPRRPLNSRSIRRSSTMRLPPTCRANEPP
jgi:pimeloyl-ACP methyl ester carboxylesterase